MEVTENNEKVKNWINAQNQLTDNFLGQCEYRDKFKKTISDNWNYPKIGVPTKKGDNYYFGYNSGLMAQTAWYKVKEKKSYKIDQNNPLNNAELFMDPN